MVERILANATRAPSAGFSQGWAFLALTEEADRQRFWPFVPNQTRHTPEMMNASLVVIALAHKAPTSTSTRRYRWRTTEFGIPDEYTPIGGIAIGYRPDDLAPQDPELVAHRRGP